MSALLDNKEEINEQKDRKTDKKKRQEKKIMFEHFSTYHVTFLYRFLLMPRK